MKRSPLVRKTPLQSRLTVKPKKRKCGNQACRKPFETFDGMRSWCSFDCGAVIAQEALAKKKGREAKAERAQDKAKKEALQPRKWWLAKTKKAVHAYIRARDEGEFCITCDTVLVKIGRVGGDYDAGHFRSVGSAKHLEFEEDNIHGQCKQCNMHEAGKAVDYRINLIQRIGLERVEALEADNRPRHYSIEDLQALEVKFKQKLKALKAAGTD
jgi:hypothetical protein